MRTDTLMTMFFMTLVLCGCGVESFFDGGAPLAILAALVALGCAAVLGNRQE